VHFIIVESLPVEKRKTTLIFFGTEEAQPSCVLDQQMNTHPQPRVVFFLFTSFFPAEQLVDLQSKT
jgi:hypothetical protein